MQTELADKRYSPGPYREFTIYDRKTRRISAAPYRDRVVHHALCNVIEPIFERSFIHDSYACRAGKGTHAAVNRFTQHAGKYKYVLKTDVQKYFPSIDHQILGEKIERKIKCPDTLWLTHLIIAKSNAQDEVTTYFPGDDLFTPFHRRKGIPIGNLTSQFFANIYLNDLDHFIKERLHCRAYIRYVDDLTVFDDNKRRLWSIREQIADFLCHERLMLHPRKTTVMPISEGVDHLGYRVYSTHRRLRKDNIYRFIHRLKRLQEDYKTGKKTLKELSPFIQSWLGHAAHADTYGLRRFVLEEHPFVK
ncbi:MAG: RNA-directed DNA polymerase [Smithellaceae bacterium]|nr:RNA-directed DNA polymerase [Smithellaceae bacterium]